MRSSSVMTSCQRAANCAFKSPIEPGENSHSKLNEKSEIKLSEQKSCQLRLTDSRLVSLTFR